MQLLDFQDLPRSSRNLSRKMTLRHGKTLRQPLFVGSYLTSPSLTSHEIYDTLKKTSHAFQRHQDHEKPTSGTTSTMREKINESKKSVLEIWHIFPCEKPSSHTKSSQLTAIWSPSLELQERGQHWLRRATLDSPISSPVWPESLMEKRRKTTRTPLLPGAITISTKLRFV